MFHAARITSSSFRGNEKKLRLKPEIIRLYQAGKGCPQISKKLGLGQTAINHWLREWGIGIRSSGEARGLACVGNKKEMCKEEIIGLYETKKNCSQIGKKFGLDNGTIGRWLREWGVKIRSRSEAVSLSKIGNKKEMCKEEIIRLYLSGKTTVWIGKKFGLTDSTIGRWLHERHIPIRKKHTAESRAKMRVAQAGKNHPMFGKKHSAETRAKMSLARKAYHSQNPDVAA
jgi:intein-encoded DNA endonuclease-like protein